MEILDSSHAQEISDLARTIWMEYFPTFLDREGVEVLFDEWQSADAIKKQIEEEGHMYSFLIHNGEKIGYYCVRPEENALFISKAYVDVKYRGKGFGKRILKEMVEYGRSSGLKTAYLHVNKSNKLAIDVYTAMGFRVTEETYEEVSEGVFRDDYTMEYTY
jgi:ribosomal protein S18 acetylase RimI-like enzyme